jgi:hypothetical protein
MLSKSHMTDSVTTIGPANFLLGGLSTGMLGQAQFGINGINLP